ncbi:MAG: GTPase family protein [Hyphomicrobiaceae bacterium]
MSEQDTPASIVRWMARTFEKLMGSGGADGTPQAEREVVAAAQAAAPVIWLIGKVQAGKSSIVKALTGASGAEVGSGFRPCTRTARIFDFPSEAPVIRFLDTRGLGEVGYDPEADLAVAEGHAEALIVVMRAMDQQQDEVLAAVAEVLKRRPGWPVIVAQTCLHEGYGPGDEHVQPYPFTRDCAGMPGRKVPQALARALAHQRTLAKAHFKGASALFFVPLDLTLPEDGYVPVDYGLDALMQALAAAAPAAITATLHEMVDGAADRAARGARPLILGHASAAAAADLVPVAGAVAVPGVQARMLKRLGDARHVSWDRRMLAEFGTCLGAGIVTRIAARFGIRQAVKLIPVYGQTVGAAAAAVTSFATTYALGLAGLEFLRRRELGAVDASAIAKAYRDGLEQAFQLARERGVGAAKGDPAQQ